MNTQHNGEIRGYMSRQKKQEKAEASRAKKAHRDWKKTFKEITTDLWLNDWFIKIGLAVSGIQLAVSFTYLTGSGWAIFLSGASAVGKAAFVEGGVWLVNRAIVWARVLKMNFFVKIIMWLILATLMYMSVRANLDYEHEKKLNIKYPPTNGNPAIIPNAKNVSRFLDSDEQTDAWFRGGLVPFIVFAAIIGRRVMTSSRDEFEKEEAKRFKSSEYQATLRTKKKNLEKVLGGE
jgi:hypothetical protein